MKILLSSHVFHPSVGGIEAMSEMLASEFVSHGEEVRVITQTVGEESRCFPYSIFRRPGAWQLIRLVGWSDVVLHVNISLRSGWPLLFGVRPWVISHQTWIPTGMRGIVKRSCSRMAHNIAVSDAMARSLKAPSTIIPNAYDHELFRVLADVPRDRDLVFVGRLVSDKGCASALKALRILKNRGLCPNLTIVGSGPEGAALRQLASELGVSSQVFFAGLRRGEDLARELNRHRVMVVPSLWAEPFGIVALEGIACGCSVAGSNGGGLPEAIGPCGRTFPNGDVSALADCLAEMLASKESFGDYRRRAEAHLSSLRKSVIARQYLNVLKDAVNSFRRASAANHLRQQAC